MPRGLGPSQGLPDFLLSTHTQAVSIRMNLQAACLPSMVSALTKVCVVVQYEFQCFASIPRHPLDTGFGSLHLVSKKYCLKTLLLMLTSPNTVTSLPLMSVAVVLSPTHMLTLSHTENSPRCNTGCAVLLVLAVLLREPAPLRNPALCPDTGGGCVLNSTRGERKRRLLKNLGSTVILRASVLPIVHVGWPRDVCGAAWGAWCPSPPWGLSREGSAGYSSGASSSDFGAACVPIKKATVRV